MLFILPVCDTIGLLISLKPFPALHLCSAAGDKEIESFVHIPLFSDGLPRCCCVSPRRSMYLLEGGCDHYVMCFAYALHVRRQKLVPLSCLFAKPFELVIEIDFH